MGSRQAGGEVMDNNTIDFIVVLLRGLERLTEYFTCFLVGLFAAFLILYACHPGQLCWEVSDCPEPAALWTVYSNGDTTKYTMDEFANYLCADTIAILNAKLLEAPDGNL